MLLMLLIIIVVVIIMLLVLLIIVIVIVIVVLLLLILHFVIVTTVLLLFMIIIIIVRVVGVRWGGRGRFAISKFDDGLRGQRQIQLEFLGLLDRVKPVRHGDFEVIALVSLLGGILQGHGVLGMDANDTGGTRCHVPGETVFVAHSRCSLEGQEGASRMQVGVSEFHDTVLGIAIRASAHGGGSKSDKCDALANQLHCSSNTMGKEC
ncbi:uncharacterized protein BYT42DRAFT_553833, partial [Radiomyces spectabilis]|uniref:uncharacterized protein n=1 Tax=Radiomyces spectabilis TaxID=64574 RepID=UPI00221FE0D4